MKKKVKNMLGAILILAIPVAVLILVALNLSSVTQEEPEYWCSGSGTWDADAKECDEFPAGTCYMWATCIDDGLGADAYVWMRAPFTPEETFSADKIGVAIKGFEYFRTPSFSVDIEVSIETVDGNLVARGDRSIYLISGSSAAGSAKSPPGTSWRDLAWNYPQHYEFTEGVTYYVIVELSVSSSKGGSILMESYSTDRGTEQGIALGDILLRKY